MSFRRLTGSDHSIPRAATTRASGAAIRRDAHAQMARSIQAQLTREQDWPARHEGDRQAAGIGSLENDVAARGAPIEGPCFARLHASIAERKLDWAWQNGLDTAKLSGESEQPEARRADTGISARAVWLGGIACALLAAGIISALATFQSNRPLPFETWARRDLMQRTDGMPGRTAAEGERGEADAALAVEARLEPSDLDLAGLGPILATASAAKEFAAGLPARSRADAVVGTGAARPLPGLRRSMLRPMLVSSSPLHSDEAMRLRSRP